MTVRWHVLTAFFCTVASSIEVCAKPDSANAAAAPRRIEARRSARGRSFGWTGIRSSVYRGVNTKGNRG